MSTGIIILAAGNSSRMGRPKQLLQYKGNSLLQIITDAASASSLEPIVLVVGAHAEELLEAHSELKLHIIHNDNWQQGMSASIRTGITEMLRLVPAVANIILTVSDQPFINAQVFKAMLAQHALTGKDIIACKYAETLGTPMLFGKKYFNLLLNLAGRNGAKNLLNLYPEDVESVKFELGNIDIDTETDYQNLTQQQ